MNSSDLFTATSISLRVDPSLAERSSASQTMAVPPTR